MAYYNIHYFLITAFVIERIYYIIIEQIFNEVDKTTKTSFYEKDKNGKTTKSWFYENFKDCPSFKEYVKENGITKVLKQLHLYRMTGRGENRKVMCNPYIWVLVAMEMNPILYAKVVGWIRLDWIRLDWIEQ